MIQIETVGRQRSDLAEAQPGIERDRPNGPVADRNSFDESLSLLRGRDSISPTIEGRKLKGVGRVDCNIAPNVWGDKGAPRTRTSLVSSRWRKAHGLPQHAAL
jgi:hypothetical protein